MCLYPSGLRTDPGFWYPERAQFCPGPPLHGCGVSGFLHGHVLWHELLAGLGPVDPCPGRLRADHLQSRLSSHAEGAGGQPLCRRHGTPHDSRRDCALFFRHVNEMVHYSLHPECSYLWRPGHSPAASHRHSGDPCRHGAVAALYQEEPRLELPWRRPPSIGRGRCSAVSR